MGAMQNNPKETKGNGSKRGSVKNADRLEAFGRARSTGNASWGEIDCSRIQAAIVEITRLGGAMTFGLSRDKGAHFVSLLLDDRRKTLWFNGDADLDDELHTVIVTLEQLD